MLTLVLKGTLDDAQQAASLAFNTGLAIEVVDVEGKSLFTATPTTCQEQCECAEQGLECTIVDEPHPVLEKADPPSVETVPEPVVPAPAETPAE